MRKRAAFLGVLAGAAVIAAAAVAVARFSGGAVPETAGGQLVSVAQARALGARWRAEKSEELGRQYAQALIGAGLYDEVLAEIERGLFGSDNDAARIFRAEASLRQGRFDEAMAAARSGENPYFGYARARAAYALTGDRDAVFADLASALRGPKELASEAWLFRARLALDANDFDGAEAASRRALEAGAAASRVELIGIEKSVRAGDLEAAAGKLDARSERRRSIADPEDYRLAVMIKLRAGEARAAVRLADRMRTGAVDSGRARLVAALAKHLAGDDAQAWSLVSAHLAAAPKDWTALDLAAAIARAVGRNDDAARLLARLEKERPALAVLRTTRINAAVLDASFEALTGPNGNCSAEGAATMLLGPGVAIHGLEEARGDELAIANIAAAISSGDERRMKSQALAVLKDKSSPLGLALAGLAFRKLDDMGNASQSLTLSSEMAPDFLAPVLLHSELLAQGGAYKEAAMRLNSFLSRHGDDPRARLALARVEARGGDPVAASRSFALVPPALVFAEEETAALYGAAAKAAGGEARAEMQKAARANAPSSRILGVALATAGDDAGAAAALRNAVIAAPEDEGLARRYLEIMTMLGRAEEARSLLGEIERRLRPA